MKIVVILTTVRMNNTDKKEWNFQVGFWKGPDFCDVLSVSSFKTHSNMNNVKNEGGGLLDRWLNTCPMIWTIAGYLELPWKPIVKKNAEKWDATCAKIQYETNWKINKVTGFAFHLGQITKYVQVVFLYL